ncbi:MAG: ATP-grasp domain-containing protein [Oscillospiraceae bacterium]|nr:ATP-grasp domain-containing protein [Oscillospiraceae bacterium]
MDFKEYDFLPVILGGDITAYSLVRSFYEQYQVKSLAVSMSRGGPVVMSGLCENLYCPNLESEEALIPTLMEIGEKYGKDKKLIVLGCGDWYVRILIENKDRLSEHYIVPYIDEALMNRVTLKDKFYEIMEELGIPYPKTFVYDCHTHFDPHADKPQLPEKLGFDYPVIAKTANSAMYHYAKFPGKKKVFCFDRREQLEEMLRNLATSSYDYKFLIQDRIPGDDTGMRVLTCYCDASSRVRFAALGHTLLEEHTPSALGNPCCIINEADMEVVNQAQRFLKHIGYVGYANFDLKYDPRDGQYKFFEINIRLGRSNYYVTGSGFNAVKWLIDDYIDRKEFKGLTVADQEHLFTFVPKYVIKKFVGDAELRDRALRLIKEEKWSNPLIYGPDMTLKRRAYVAAYELNQIRKFEKYYVN